MSPSQRIVRVLSTSWLHLMAPTSSEAVVPSTDINVDNAQAEARELEKMGFFTVKRQNHGVVGVHARLELHNNTFRQEEVCPGLWISKGREKFIADILPGHFEGPMSHVFGEGYRLSQIRFAYSRTPVRGASATDPFSYLRIVEWQ